MATKPHSHDRAPLEGRARLVFERLGYSVRYDGDALRAERDGKRVRILTLRGEEDIPDRVVDHEDTATDKYCLVTDGEDALSLKERTDDAVPDGVDYAVVGLREEGYFVA